MHAKYLFTYFVRKTEQLTIKFISNFYLPLTTTSLSSGGVSMSVLSVVEECGRWHLSSRSPAATGRCWPPHLRSAHSPLAHDPAHNIRPSHHGLTWSLSFGVLCFIFYPPVKQFAWTQLTVYPHWQHTRFFVTFEDENFGQSLIKSILAQFETLEVSGIVKSSTVLEAATHKQVHKY